MSARPICFLDVDGVINACPNLPAGKAECEFEARGYPICFPKGCVKNVKTLAGAFDMVWLTTWEDTANEHFVERLTGEGDWPHVSWIKFGAKLVGAKVWLEEQGLEGTPFVQIDDDFYDYEVHELKHRDFDLELEFPQPRLHIAPRCAEGLTDEHVGQALAFVEGLG